MKRLDIFTTAVTVACLCLAQGVTESFLPASAQALNGYRMKQKMEYYGQIDIHATAQGTRIDAREVQCFLLPSSTALLFNYTNKMYCEMPHEIWLDRVGANDSKLSQVAKGNIGVCANHKVTQYVADCYKLGRSRPEFRIEFWTTTDMVLPKQVMDAYLQFLGLPPGYGMPLRIVRHYPDNHTEVFLATYEAKPEVIKLTDLHPPQSGFTRARDEMEVLLTDSSSSSSSSSQRQYTRR